MGQTGGAIVASALEKSLNKPAADITGDVVTAVCVPGLTVLENRLAGEVAYLKKKMPKINVLASFDSKPDRERNFALWDQAIRKTPKALTYIDPCEEGEENIPKILENDKVKVPLVSYDSPEEVREDVAKGSITAVVPANFFSQSYLAAYIAAQALLQGKPLPQGWVKVPHVTVDKSNIAAYQKAWEKPETGLRAFYSAQIEATRDNLPATLPDPDFTPIRRNDRCVSAAPCGAALIHCYVLPAPAAIGSTRESDRTVSVIYSARGISKRFGAVQALSDVDFDVVEGKVNGLVGANGAGKSTLLKIIAGALPPDSGELALDGRPLAMTSITACVPGRDRNRFAGTQSVPGAQRRRKSAAGARRRASGTRRGAFARRAHGVLEKLGVDVSLRTPLYLLSLADRQLVEIARALLQNPRVLILDEPTSSLHVAEVERLHEIIRGLCDSGIGIVYVSHFLEEILEISDNLVIFRNGRRVQADFAPGVDRLKAVVAAMLGETPESAGERARRSGDDGAAAGHFPKVKVGPLRITGLRGPAIS